MFTAVVLTVVVFGVLAGIILGIRRSAKTGVPPPDVLERATRRAQQMVAEDDK